MAEKAMTIYVDDLRSVGQTGKWRYWQACHLFSDPGSLDDLHDFARSIGLQASWLQDAIMPHYDITEHKRAAAISRGAIAVGRRRTVEVKRAWRAYRIEQLKAKGIEV